MKINKIFMENIRSHIRSTVQFGDGFNCLVGGVGEGKSSILYAIHFGIFGRALWRSYDYLLREDQSIGKIAIEFEHGGRRYALTRALRRERGAFSQDTSQLALYEGDKLIASGKKSAIDDQLKAVTGLDEDIFKNIIWIQQERLKELINIEPAKRQQTIDELLRLSEFLNARANLHEFERDYEVEKSLYEKEADVIDIENLRKQYDTTYKDLVDLQLELENLKTELAKAEAAYKEAEEELQKLKDLKDKTEELRRTEAGIKATLENTVNEISHFHDEVGNKQTLLGEIEATLRETLGKLTTIGLQPNQSTEELTRIEQSLEDQERNIHGRQEGVKTEMQRGAEAKAMLEKESKCPICQRTLDEGYRNALIRQYEENQVEGQDQLKKLDAELAQLGEQRRIIKEVISTLTIAMPRKDDAGKTLDELSEQLAEKQRLQVQLGEQLASVTKEISKFTPEQLDEATLVREKMHEHFIGVKNRLEFGVRTVEERGKRAEELKKRLDSAEEKVKRKLKLGRLLGTIGDFREAYKAIGPKLREELVLGLTRYIQRVLDDMTAGTERQYLVEIDENYTPSLREEEYWREVSLLSGGERTLLAFAYKIGLGQLIMEARGLSLDLLILDEPTESLGPEDGSIDRLADAISRLKSIEQIIAVTHSEEFAEKAEHIIRIRKEAGKSLVEYAR